MRKLENLLNAPASPGKLVGVFISLLQQSHDFLITLLWRNVNTISHQFFSFSTGIFCKPCQAFTWIIWIVSTTSLNTDKKYSKFNGLRSKTSTSTSGTACCRSNLNNISFTDGSAVFKLVLLKSAGILCLLTFSTGIHYRFAVFCVLHLSNFFPGPGLIPSFWDHMN